MREGLELEGREMTETYKQLADRLAKGINFKENACILSVGTPIGQMTSVKTTFDGDATKVIIVTAEIIRQLLDLLDEENACFAMNCFMEAIEDYQRS